MVEMLPRHAIHREIPAQPVPEYRVLSDAKRQPNRNKEGNIEEKGGAEIQRRTRAATAPVQRYGKG
jgi:hypothetical protein